jgi:hypothetical protein
MKFLLWKIRLTKDGHDDIGKYWGPGDPVYCYYPEDDEWAHDEWCDYLRAPTRTAAKHIIREQYPNARFY